MIVSGAAGALWGVPIAEPPRSLDDGTAPVMARVAPNEIDAALTTMNLPSNVAARLKQQDRNCAPPLAWVSIARAPGTKGGKIRLLSGDYGSPIFTLTDGPLRVALPYPAAYEEGHGILSILSDADGATVALTPAWHTPVQRGRASHDVTWKPANACVKGKS